MGFKYTYENEEHEVENDVQVLPTAGKYLTDNITIETEEAGAPFSYERLDEYLLRLHFINIPDEAQSNSALSGGCTSYVNGGKLYRNFDWDYDDSVTVQVWTEQFKGTAFTADLSNRNLAQLPYRIVDGINNYGIKVATHILFNDWDYVGSGNTPLHKIPYILLTNMQQISDINSTVIQSALADIKVDDALISLGYLAQFIVTDGTTTYVILPPTTSSGSYVVVNATSNPKLTNFRWVNRATVNRTDNDIQQHPTGIERWNNVGDGYQELRFTKAYQNSNRLSEFIGIDDTDKNSTDQELTAIYQRAHQAYLTRERDSTTWHTMHSVVYGNDIEHFFIQEDYSKDYVTTGGTSLKLAPIKTNGEFSATHFVQVETVKADSKDNYFDSGISLQGKIPFIEKAELLHNYANASQGYFGFVFGGSSSYGFGFWGNTIMRYICAPNETIEKGSLGTGANLNTWFQEASGTTLTLKMRKPNGTVETCGTKSYSPIEVGTTVAFGFLKNDTSSAVPQAFGIIKIKDLLTGDYIFNFTPMKDDDGHCWLYDDETEELTRLPDGWIPGAVVSGGIEITGDSYAPFTADVDDKFLGIHVKEMLGTSIDMSHFDMSNLGVIPERAFDHQFYQRGQNLPSLIQYNGATVNDYGCYYALSNCKSDADHTDVIMPYLTTIGIYAFEYFISDSSRTYSKHIRDILIGNSKNNMTVGTYGLAYFVYGYSNLRDVIVRGLQRITNTYACAYMCRGITTSSACTIDGDFGFPDLTEINANYALQYCFADRQFDVNTPKVFNPLPKLENVNGSSALAYFFRYAKANRDSVFSFPKLKNLGNTSGTGICQYMFNSTSGLWKYCWFQSLEQIGYAGTSSYQTFSSAFIALSSEGTNPNCYQLCMPNLKRILSNYTGTTATYGTFNGCTALQKVWMPRLEQVTGAAQTKSLFNNCSGLKEIHFGIINEAYIKSLNGYATKFGATNATIYFDCVNTILVDGVPYDRDGEDYVVGPTHQINANYNFTHPDDRYAWKSQLDNSVIYTLECWTPQVGDTVYDADDAAVGTIEEIEPVVTTHNLTWDVDAWQNEGTAVTISGREYTYAERNNLPIRFIGTTQLSWRFIVTQYEESSSLFYNNVNLPKDTAVTLTADTTIRVSFITCLAFDTKITMFDGTERAVETLGTGDEVLGYNGIKQTIVEVSQGGCDGYDEWYFSDGTVITTAHRHRLYNVEREAFAYLDEWKIGESTLDINGNQVQLIDHKHFNKHIRHATLFCEPNNTYYANGLLAGNRYSNFKEVANESLRS